MLASLFVNRINLKIVTQERFVKMDINIRPMKIEDYDQLYELWKTIRGFGIRSIDDSREGTERFLKRNPTTSIVAEADGKRSVS